MKVKFIAMTVKKRRKTVMSWELRVSVTERQYQQINTVSPISVGRDCYILQKYGTNERQGNEINEALTVKEELFYLLFQALKDAWLIN